MSLDLSAGGMSDMACLWYSAAATEQIQTTAGVLHKLTCRKAVCLPYDQRSAVGRTVKRSK